MKLFIIIILVSFSFAASAQNFFKPIPKIVKAKTTNKSIIIAPNGDVTFWAFRPVASAVTLYVDGEVQAAAGGGISYQNITQKAADGRSTVNYSANFVVLAGGAISGDENKGDIQKCAVYLAALNNTIGLGYGFSKQEDPITLKKKWKGGLAVVWTYNFNN